MGDQQFGIDPAMIDYVAEEVHSVHEMGVQPAVVVGGGNIFRGVAASSYGMDRASADHMGMLATVINCLALQDALERRGLQTRTQTAISMHELAEPYILRRAVRHLEKAGWFFSVPVPATPISPPIRPPCSGPRRSMLRSC